MNLLEDWEGNTSYGPGAAVDLPVAEPLPLEPDIGSPRHDQDRARFSLDTVERQINRGRGHVLAFAAAADAVALLTSRSFFLRYDLSSGTTPVVEAELLRGQSLHAGSLWMDPTGAHALCTLHTSQQASESHYIHANWRKSRLLGKLKNIPVSSVAWSEDATDASSGDICLGTSSGELYEAVLEERERRDRTFRKLLDLQEAGSEAIRGLFQHSLPEGRHLVLLTTASRLYCFAGPGPLQALFAQYPADASDLTNFVEFPAEARTLGQLTTHSLPDEPGQLQFAWLSEAGVFHGRIDVTRSTVPPSALEYLPHRGLLPFPQSLSSSSGGALQAPSMLLAAGHTQYHHVLLYRQRLVMVSRISELVVQELPLADRAGLAGKPVGLAVDDVTPTLYLYTTEALYEVAVRDEEANLWELYLHKGSFSAAFRHCRNQGQRDAVRVAEAESLMARGEAVQAARLFGSIMTPHPPFEDVALRLVDTGSPDALQAFLVAKLDALAPADKAQATMVATWLLELYMDQINRALLEEPPPPVTPQPGSPPEQAAAGHGAGANGDLSGEATAPVAGLVQQLHRFLKQNVDVLDPHVTATLLLSYGRMEDLMQYAFFRQDNEAVLELLMQRGESRRALAVLRQPNLSQELMYKFAPSLMASIPAETVDVWKAARPALDPRRLLPALLRLGEPSAAQGPRAEALRYVQFCISHLESTDLALHNLAVALYMNAEDEGPLLAYLASARNSLGRTLYDAQYALRLARQRRKHHACVALFCELRLYEDAVQLALTISKEMAMAVANKPEDDAALQRKLWLAIARRLVQSACSSDGEDTAVSGISQVNDLLRDAGGLVKIEDLLPLFPDFVTIDAFREAIHESLEQYSAHIDQLKQEMSDATRIADALRKDMASLQKRTATLDLAQPCARCGQPLGSAAPQSVGPRGGSVPALYLFPTGNAFHGVCAAAEVVALAIPAQAAKVRDLLGQLAQAPSSPGQEEQSSQLTRSLEGLVASEDPFSGEIVTRYIDLPFITASQQPDHQLWHI